jgi:hypothetical protein
MTERILKSILNIVAITFPLAEANTQQIHRGRVFSAIANNSKRLASPSRQNPNFNADEWAK